MCVLLLCQTLVSFVLLLFCNRQFYCSGDIFLRCWRNCQDIHRHISVVKVSKAYHILRVVLFSVKYRIWGGEVRIFREKSRGIFLLSSFCFHFLPVWKSWKNLYNWRGLLLWNHSVLWLMLPKKGTDFCSVSFPFCSSKSEIYRLDRKPLENFCATNKQILFYKC
jgi:hypothetical protein